MIFKQRGIIDPWTLGFLISLTSLTVTQPWDGENSTVSELNTEEKTEIVVINNKLKSLKK